jgi:hypothetical protein
VERPLAWVRLGPDGDVYVSRSHTDPPSFGDPQPLHLTNARLYHFDIRNGNLVRAYILGLDGGLNSPTGFDFMPGDATDCNTNHFPDSCDIAQAVSLDCNGNNRPDECDPICPLIVCAQPQGATVEVGGAAAFSVTLSNTGASAYAWRKGGVPLADGGAVSGASTSTLTINSVAPGDAGDYDVLMTTACGPVASAAATLVVIPPCGSADFDGDGDVGSDFDIEAFFACIGGDCCPMCESPDFDGDGDPGTDFDIEAFFRVLGGGNC